MHERNLLILHSVGHEALSDWETVKNRVEYFAPDIDVRIVSRVHKFPLKTPDPRVADWIATRPSLIFAPLLAPEFVFPRGKRYTGKRLSKLEQSNRLRAAGLPSPRSVLLVPGLLLNRDLWGDYVIVKPMHGTRGIGVRLVKTEDVGKRFRDLSHYQGQDHEMIVQQFVAHTNDEGYPQDWRALSIFGKPLYVHRRQWATKQKSLDEMVSSFSGDIASNARGAERSRTLVKDERIIDLCRRAADVFPEIPVLALDIVIDRESDDMSILEVNPTGGSWHLSSQYARQHFDAKMRRAMYEQFDALQTTADILIEKTRREAL